METTTFPGGFPVSTAGDVDEHGDVVGTLMRRLRDPLERRLRAACCEDSDIDLDEHVARVLAIVDHVRRIGR